MGQLTLRSRSAGGLRPGTHALQRHPTLLDATERPAVDVACGEDGKCAVDVLGCDDGDHADAHVERLLHLGALDASALRDHGEDRSGAPGSAIEFGDQALGHDAREVVGEAATGDVAERAHVGLGSECQAVLGVDLGGLEQFLTERAAEFVDVCAQVHAVDLEQDLAGQ